MCLFLCPGCFQLSGDRPAAVSLMFFQCFLGQRTFGQRICGQATFSQRSFGQRSFGQRSFGQRPLGQRSLGHRSCGQRYVRNYNQTRRFSVQAREGGSEICTLAPRNKTEHNQNNFRFSSGRGEELDPYAIQRIQNIKNRSAMQPHHITLHSTIHLIGIQIRQLEGPAVKHITMASDL